MKKEITLVLLTLFVLPCFAVPRSRVDRYGHQKCEITWNYAAGPDDTNLAENNWGDGWTHAIRHIFLLDPDKNSGINGGITRFMVTLYSDVNSGYYDYRYKVISYIWYKNGTSEKYSEYDFLGTQLAEALEIFYQNSLGYEIICYSEDGPFAMLEAFGGYNQ